jgi:hypothetical protein
LSSIVWICWFSLCLWWAGFLGELGSGIAGGVLGGVVALHLLHVLGGGVAGGGHPRNLHSRQQDL